MIVIWAAVTIEQILWLSRGETVQHSEANCPTLEEIVQQQNSRLSDRIGSDKSAFVAIEQVIIIM